MYHNYGPMMNHGGWGWGVLAMLFWAIAFVVILYVVVRLLKGHETHEGGNGMVDPLDIAKERYAKGEITKDQFEQLKKDLSK